MEMYMSREGWIPLTGLTNDSYMSRKEWNSIGIPFTGLTMDSYMSRELTGLTMDMYIPREGWYHINRLNQR